MLRGLDLSKGGADLTFQCNKSKLRELHEHFEQCHPRPRTCAQPTQPRLLEQRSRPRPFISRPACCLRQGAPRVPVDRRGTLVALYYAYLACVSFGEIYLDRFVLIHIWPPLHPRFCTIWDCISSSLIYGPFFEDIPPGTALLDPSLLRDRAHVSCDSRGCH